MEMDLEGIINWNKLDKQTLYDLIYMWNLKRLIKKKKSEMVVIKGMPQSRPTLCDPTDCSPTRLLCPWVSPGKNTRLGCHSLLQEILPTEIKPMFPASQADSLWSEPSEKPCEIWYSAATMWFKCYKSHKGLTYSEKGMIFFLNQTAKVTWKVGCQAMLCEWVRRRKF